MLLTVTAVGSLSYLHAEDRKSNPFTVGFNESEIVEDYTVPDSLDEGTDISKMVQVKNSGSVPCYVRVLAVPSSEPDSFCLGTCETADDDLESDKLWYHEEGWDHYYYYKRILQPGETTELLFTEITVLSDLKELEKADVEDAQIMIYEESNQAEGYRNCLEAFQQEGGE